MLLLQNGRVIDPKSGLDQVMDLVTDDKKILELGNDLRKIPGCPGDRRHRSCGGSGTH